ncbi:hypothetical protein ACFY7C_09865 [Streptomyces sp. NPDC012769]|uniref:hypothetical protein n=1 Tax=Streptomyces sp. NPDC012769 TaxID=3364848 RepID=UPI003689B9E9
MDGETTLEGVDTSVDSGNADATADLGSCSGAMSRGETCEITMQVTAYEPGPYSGVLTVETSAGETLTVPFSGQAVGDDPTATTSPAPETPEPTDPTPTIDPTESPDPGIT